MCTVLPISSGTERGCGGAAPSKIGQNLSNYTLFYLFWALHPPNWPSWIHPNTPNRSLISLTPALINSFFLSSSHPPSFHPPFIFLPSLFFPPSFFSSFLSTSTNRSPTWLEVKVLPLLSPPSIFFPFFLSWIYILPSLDTSSFLYITLPPSILSPSLLSSYHPPSFCPITLPPSLLSPSLLLSYHPPSFHPITLPPFFSPGPPFNTTNRSLTWLVV